jgi:hypothetical protein
MVMVVKQRGDEWSERYPEGNTRWFHKDTHDVSLAAQALLDFFNGGEPGGRPKRELVRAYVEDSDAPANRPHDWTKTNLVTVMGRGGAHDTCRCTVCGITGKRHGVGLPVRDPAFRAKVYGTCDGAVQQLAKLKLKREEKS